MTVELNVPQSKFIAMPEKFRAFVAGFGSGKTVVGCAAQCIHFAQHPRVNQGYFAPTYPLIRDIFYPTADEVGHWFGFTTRARTGDKEVDFFRGKKYYGTTICRTMDNPQNIVGFKIGRALVDELDVLPKEKASAAWNKIIARLRWADMQNGIDVTTTPEGFKFTYERFAKIGGEKYGYIQASTYDNEANLPSDYIESMLETYPTELIEAYLRGRFVNLTSGTIYHTYDRSQHSTNEVWDGSEAIHVGMDFNVCNMSAAISVIRENKVYFIDEITGGYDTPSVITTLEERYPDTKINIYPDASGKNRNPQAASETSIGLLEQAGFAVHAHSKNPFVKDRILAVNTNFTKGNIFVNVAKCPNTAENLEQQIYNAAGEPDKTQGKDHTNDAAGYLICYKYPVIKPTTRRRSVIF